MQVSSDFIAAKGVTSSHIFLVTMPGIMHGMQFIINKNTLYNVKTYAIIIFLCCFSQLFVCLVYCFISASFVKRSLFLQLYVSFIYLSWMMLEKVLKKMLFATESSNTIYVETGNFPCFIVWKFSFPNQCFNYFLQFLIHI